MTEKLETVIEKISTGRLKPYFRWLNNYKIKRKVEESRTVVEDMEEWMMPESSE
jgi:hypothetical protein